MLKKVFAPVFLWKGFTQQGQWLEGRMRSHDPEWVQKYLYYYGISLSRLKLRDQWSDRFLFSMTPKKIRLLIRQLLTLIKADISVSQSMMTMAQAQSNIYLKALLLTFHKRLEAGETLSVILKDYPYYFDSLVCHLLYAGEQSGTFVAMFERLADHQERAEHLRSELRKALFYPVTIFIFSLFITVGLLVMVVPQFALIFQQAGASLPLATRFVLSVSAGLQRYYAYYLLAGWGIFLLNRYLARFYRVRRYKSYTLLKVPLLGSLFKKIYMARFSRTLATLLEADILLIEALSLAAGTTNSVLVQELTQAMINAVTQGKPLYSAMASSRIFSAMMVQMVLLGEKTGHLSLVLNKAAFIYEQEVEESVAVFRYSLEPLMMAFIGSIVGGIMIALYLPLFELGSVIA